jgi:hypothetical protein
MKKHPLVIVAATALFFVVSCAKKVDVTKNYNDEAYSNWAVSTIGINSIVIPEGVVWDTAYHAQPTDYIDLSTKGKIDFYINQQHHTDFYDTTKYDLLKDTSIPVGGGPGFDYISFHITAGNKASIKTSVFGVDAGTQITYNLQK